MSSQGADHDINFDSHQVESYDENNESRNVAMTFNSTNSMNPIFVMESDGEDAATVVSPRTLEEPITEKAPQEMSERNQNAGDVPDLPNLSDSASAASEDENRKSEAKKKGRKSNACM